MASMIRVTKRCPFCDVTSTLNVDKEQYERHLAGASVADAFPDFDAFQNETMRSGVCSKCLSAVYSVPIDGEDWGSRIGECPVCKTSIWDKKHHAFDKVYQCAGCGELLKKAAFMTLVRA